MNTHLPQLRVAVVRHNKTQDTTRQRASQDAFHRLSVRLSNRLGHASVFYIALLVVIGWAVSGPLFEYSNTWQLVINTGTTVVTFLMVFIIQNTQNRDAKAMQLKLDELISATRAARSEFVDVEDLTDAELDELQEQFKQMHDALRKRR